MDSPVHRVSLGDTWSRRVHPDMASERFIQSFSVEQLTNILDGGAQNTALRRKVESIIHSDPEFSVKDNYFMTQNERYVAAIQKRFHFQIIAKRLGWLENSPEFYYAYRALSGELALGLHTVFLKSLQSLGSEEQIAKWTPLCNEFRIIASYAQTELGHGEPAFLHARFQKAHSQLSSQRLCISYGNIPAGGSQGSGRRGFPFLV